jgi:uncharacterized membrane protein YcaP (DUF421 family)
LLIAIAVQIAMVGPDASLVGGLQAVLALLRLNPLVAWLWLCWPQLRRAFEGSPTLLVLHGEAIEEH